MTFGYDALNRRTNMTDAVGTTVWTYDALGRVATERGPFGTNAVVVGYDEHGRMTSVVYGAYSARYTYDMKGRITGITAPEGGYTLAYLSNGIKRTRVTYPNGVKEMRGYDALTRMTNLVYKKWLTTLLSIDYRYDAGDRRTNEVWSTGRHLSYGYDRAHQLTDVISPSRASDRASYRYDKAGNPIRRTEMGFGVTNSFNNLNQIVSSVWTGGAITVAGAVNYPAGTVTVNSITGRIFPDRVFEVTNVTITAGTNILTAIYRGPAFTNTQMVATDKVTVVVGNAAYTHDANGNLTGDQNFTYQYDLANRLTNVILKASNISVLAISYDGLGRRIQVVRNGMTVERYVYFPGSFLVLAILDGSNAVKEFYTHGPDLSGTLGGASGIGGILSVTTNISQSTARKYLHADAMGNVVLVSDSEGTQVASYGFTPFGKLVNQVGGYQARFLFSGKELDRETGLVLFGLRYLRPADGRWTTRDIVGESAGPNLYGFVFNAPFRFIDPDGRAPQLIGADSRGRAYHSNDRDWGDWDPNWGGRRSRRSSPPDGNALDVPWNQRPDVSQGFDLVEVSGFDVLGGGVKITIGACCENGKRKKFAKAHGSFGLGAGSKAKIFKVKNIQRALKAASKSEGAISALLEADKKCPRDGFDFDVKVEGMVGFYKGQYSFLGDILTLAPNSTEGQGTGSHGPEIGWGLEASVTVSFGWIWVFE